MTYSTDLDKELQNLSVKDWDAFVQLIGPDQYMAMKICLLRAKGKSYNQIAVKLQTTYHIAVYRASVCECKPSEISHQMNEAYRASLQKLP
jgi:hypothetical protein